MISDEEVKLLFWHNYRIYGGAVGQHEQLPMQFYRGRDGHTWDNQHPASCLRHKAVFGEFGIIPEYCFGCFKVTTLPRNVIELFKLMMVYEKLELPNDNTRKCLVETRVDVSGFYKGIIYCGSIREAEEIRRLVRKQVALKISAKLETKIGRGCSEYANAYPGYETVKGGRAVMPYREEWREIEQRAEQVLVLPAQPEYSETHNSPTYTPNDVKVMVAWLRYAATIGDSSYLKISNQVLHPFSNIARPCVYRPAGA